MRRTDPRVPYILQIGAYSFSVRAWDESPLWFSKVARWDDARVWHVQVGRPGVETSAAEHGRESADWRLWIEAQYQEGIAWWHRWILKQSQSDATVVPPNEQPIQWLNPTNHWSAKERRERKQPKEHHESQAEAVQAEEQKRIAIHWWFKLKRVKRQGSWEAKYE